MSDRGAGQGLATVVFVDAEGSTELLHRLGDEAGTASVLGQLDVVRERVRAYGGHEVKSTGDGLMLVFTSPRRAVSFALASQRALAGAAPRLRFGINTGEVIEADDDSFGSAVNAASRIADRAAGGEVLVSDVVRQLVGAVPAIRFVDRGRWRLKGFADRWHLWGAEESAGDRLAPATIGRVTELGAVAELVASTAGGVGQVLLFEGEAGIGKSHLVREAIAQARRASIGVVEVTCEELVPRPGAVPHGLLGSVERGEIRARLDTLLNAPASAASSSEDRSYAVVEASIDLLEEMTRTRPFLIAAEDLHWADDLSLGVLTAIVRRVSVSRFSVVGSLRPWPRPPALDRLLERVRAGPGRHLRLDSLDEVDVHALTSSVTGAAPGQGLRERLRATAGNPLFVMELIRSLDDDGQLRIESGVVDVAQGVTPTNLNEALVRRLSWLPIETNELLRLASLLGTTFTLGDLAVITGRPVIDVAAWFREASLAGLIVGDGERLTFRHDLVREAVYGHMLPPERRDLHRAAGQALANAGASTQQIAQQFARGARSGDLEAVAWLERAALETMSVSPTNGVNLLDEAVSLAPAQWSGRAALQARMIEPLAWCGRFDEAKAIANSILAMSPEADLEFAALRGLCAMYGNRGDIPEAIVALHQAAAAPGAPDDEELRLHCMAAQLSVLSGAMSVEEATVVADETMTEAVAHDDVTTQCLAHQVLGVIATITGHSVAAREHLAAAVGLLDSGRLTSTSYLNPEPFHALNLLESGALDDARAVADTARKRAERGGALAVLPTLSGAAAGIHFSAGRWDDAVAELEAGLEVIDDTGNFSVVLYFDALLAHIALHRGDLTQAQEWLTTGAQRMSGGVAVFGADVLMGTQAEFLAAKGELEAALTLAEMTWHQTAPIRYFYGHRARGTFLVRHAVAAGRDELADSVTAELEEGARRSPVASAAAAARLCRGLVQRDPDMLLDAVALYRETPLRPELAAACEDAAGSLAVADRRDEAIALLHDAASIHDEIHAAADAARVEATLRHLRARGTRRRTARPTFGWESLTPMETTVSQYVAEGLTNPEIGERLYICRRTVESHLSHVFTKLGITSRTQLAAELMRLATTS
jgi:class 3 adenylate cyclase/DNA-binding CsgD family transcriptional regulator/tetratricopeptide (TPR) repeat protein